jgi:hypothetical protein
MTEKQCRKYIESLTRGIYWISGNKGLFTSLYPDDYERISKILNDNHVIYQGTNYPKNSDFVCTIVIEVSDIIPVIRNNKINKILKK